jgi:hypothetical protein
MFERLLVEVTVGGHCRTVKQEINLFPGLSPLVKLEAAVKIDRSAFEDSDFEK